MTKKTSRDIHLDFHLRNERIQGAQKIKPTNNRDPTTARGPTRG